MEILVTDKTDRCYACGSKRCVERHSIYRRNDENHKIAVPLCAFHHRGSSGAVHGKRGGRLDIELKKVGQRAYEKRGGTRENFIKECGESYL